MEDKEKINSVNAFGSTKNKPKLAIIIPRKIGFLEMENIPFVTNSDFFSVSIPILHESAICVCAIHTKMIDIINNPQPTFAISGFSKYQNGSKYS